MKYVILFAIKLYWFIVPAHKRNKCLFKESCSSIVFKTAKVDGAFAAIKIFVKRTKICVPNYTILFGDDFCGIVIKDNVKIKSTELSENMQAEIQMYKNIKTNFNGK